MDCVGFFVLSLQPHFPCSNPPAGLQPKLEPRRTPDPLPGTLVRVEPLDVIAQTADWVAFNKPAGLVVHRSRGANDRHTVVSLAREQFGFEIYPVNRLDRQTSGVIVMARSKDAARELSTAFAERTVEKTYQAVVRGWPLSLEQPRHSIDRPLGGKPAFTAIRLLKAAEFPEALGRFPTARFSLLELSPRTGLTHQLRRHLRGWGYPIINDRKHGDDKLNADFFQRFRIKRLLLHSRALKFPCGGETHQVQTDWNGRITGLLDYLGLKSMAEMGHL